MSHAGVVNEQVASAGECFRGVPEAGSKGVVGEVTGEGANLAAGKLVRQAGESVSPSGGGEHGHASVEHELADQFPADAGACPGDKRGLEPGLSCWHTPKFP